MKKIDNNLAIFIIVLILYSVSFIAKFNLGLAVLGIPILFYFPGKWLIEFIPAFNFKFGKFGYYSLTVLYSFSLCSLLGLLIQNITGFNSNYQILSIVLLNIILCIFYYLRSKIKIFNKISFFQKQNLDAVYMTNWHDYIPLAVLAVALLVIILINPYAQNADNYLLNLKQSIAQNFNLLVTGRAIYNSFLGLTSKFLALNISFVFRNVFIVIFFAGTLTFYDYLKRNLHSRYLIALAYLSLLAPSVILTELNIIRPQVVMIALTIPVLIVSIESMRSKNTFVSLVAIGFSIVAMLYHELGIVLVLVALIPLFVNLTRLIFIEKKIAWPYIVLSLIIIILCLEIFGISAIFGPVTFMIRYAAHFLVGFNWRWWFIGNYTTMDGANLSWTGINALFYYLYNGILLLLLLTYLLYFLIKKRMKTGNFIVIPAVYLGIFFIVAELLPRIGLFFLPNRAWVHLMIAAVVILALFLETMEKKRIKIKFLPIVLIVLIMVGYCGSVYVAKNNINAVYREEMPVANFIKNNTPENSIVLSPQGNLTLVSIYADRPFGSINANHPINKDEFEKLVNDALLKLSKDEIIILQPEIVQTIGTKKDNQIVEPQVNIIQQEIDQVIKATYFGSNPVYILYSYRKLSGISNMREYKQGTIDSANKSTYTNLGYPTVFADANTILIKIK